MNHGRSGTCENSKLSASRKVKESESNSSSSSRKTFHPQLSRNLLFPMA